MNSDIYYQILPKSKLFKFYTFIVNNLIRFHFFTSEFNAKKCWDIYAKYVISVKLVPP